MSTIEFIAGKRGNQNAINEGYVFHVNRRKDDRTNWRSNKCPARLITEAGSYVSSTPHNHDPQPADVQIQRAKVTMTNMASTTELTAKRIMATRVSSLSFENMSLMLLPRSSNIAEGWNNDFSSHVSCQNSTIWSFFECARKDQAITDRQHFNQTAFQTGAEMGTVWLGAWENRCRLQKLRNNPRIPPRCGIPNLQQDFFVLYFFLIFIILI